MNPDEIKKLTLHLNQGSDTAFQEIKTALISLPDGAKQNPVKIRQSMCVAASVYIDLIMAGASCGSFAQYFIKQVSLGTIRIQDAFCQDLDKIVGSYGYKRKRMEEFKEFISFLMANLYEHGTVRITQGGGHTMNWYVYDKKVYASDVGHADNHGKLLNTIVTADNFKYFEYVFKGGQA